MDKIPVFIGTRPELIKCLPLLNSSDIYVPIFVKQHDNIMEDSDVIYKIDIKEYVNDRLINIIMSIMNSDIFKLNWKVVLVQGDTAVAFAVAITAFNKKIPIIHLESGLRTYDLNNPWPEEGYRRMIDCITSIALCPSYNSYNNLVNENIKCKMYDWMECRY